MGLLVTAAPSDAAVCVWTIVLGSATLTVASGGFSGRILGDGNLVKTGPGVLALGGPSSNTYTGTTTVNGGTLAMLKEAGAVGAVGPVIVNSGLLALDFSEQIADAPPVTVNAGGTLQLSIVNRETIGSLEGSGTILLNHSALVVGEKSTPKGYSDRCAAPI
jgi:fibronectin-binding autotransporter adhesin